jgi:hypothetical protein
MADQALVAGEQARHAVDGRRADAEQAPRHVHGFTQGAGPRHVHAVVVARRQVHGGVQAVVVRLGVLVAAQQFGGGERLALGLEDAAGLDLASWLMRPSAGITRLRGSASATRAPGFSARVKNWLKVA